MQSLYRNPHVLYGGNIMNYHIYAYAEKNNIMFSRSRPYKKNDNCFVEQKNSTHVRQVVGYLRHDTEEERNIIDELYQNELRLYKNFFQPVMKLVSKIRIEGKIKKKYDVATTPYRRLMESDRVSKEKKEELQNIYEAQNPAELKQKIDAKLGALHRAYQKQNGSRKVETSRITSKKLVPNMVSLYIGQPVWF